MLVHRLVSRPLTCRTNDLLSQCLLPGLRMSACSKHFSTKGPATGDEQPAGQKRAATSYATIMRKSDREISLFGPKDPRTPLPGNLGLESAIYPDEALPELNADFLNPLCEEPDVITSELNIERQSRVVDQVVFPLYTAELNDIEAKSLRAMDFFECISHPCPELLAQDVRELFPGRNFGSRVTVVTVSLKNSISDTDGLIREEIIENFVALAQAIANKLQEQGYWADFIDPLVGRLMTSASSRASFLELDWRYRRLGFELRKQGTCQILRHHDYGSRDYVGSVFTSAPHNSAEILEWTRKRQTL